MLQQLQDAKRTAAAEKLKLRDETAARLASSEEAAAKQRTALETKMQKSAQELVAAEKDTRRRAERARAAAVSRAEAAEAERDKLFSKLRAVQTRLDELEARGELEASERVDAKERAQLDARAKNEEIKRLKERCARAEDALAKASGGAPVRLTASSVRGIQADINTAFRELGQGPMDVEACAALIGRIAVGIRRAGLPAGVAEAFSARIRTAAPRTGTTTSKQLRQAVLAELKALLSDKSRVLLVR